MVVIQSLFLALGGLLSVGSITIVILLLISDRGWRNGLAYKLGYVCAYTLIGVSAVWVGYTVAENRSRDPLDQTGIGNQQTTYVNLTGVRPDEFVRADQIPQLFAGNDNIIVSFANGLDDAKRRGVISG